MIIINNNNNNQGSTGVNCSKTKVTPGHGATWVIKWVATSLLLIGVAARSSGGFQVLDMSLTAIGAAGWAWVGYKWHDRALLVVNSAALVMILGGVFRISVG
jgi:hypothetical protein